MDMLKSSVEILAFGTTDSPREIRAILEDAESPITRKTIETLYKSVIDKSHVDFGDIPKSKGDITKYSGYQSMMDVLATMRVMAKEDPTYASVTMYIEIISVAIANLTQNRVFYTQAFSKNNTILKLEYNSFVYACVEAVTALLFQFADYMKTPSSHKLVPVIKNTKYRADEFFVSQLKEYNEINKTGNYQKYLSEMLKGGTENFALTTSFIVGAAAITIGVMTSIVPVTRKIIYTIQDGRNKLADCLELQAYFLELNAQYLRANQPKGEKTETVIKKQEALRVKFLRLSDKLRVRSIKQEELSKKNLDEDNRTISMNSMRDEVDNNDVLIV